MSDFYFLDLVAEWDLWLTVPVQRVYYMASLGKDQNLQAEVQLLLNVYCFCTFTVLKSCTRIILNWGSSVICVPYIRTLTLLSGHKHTIFYFCFLLSFGFFSPEVL